LIRSRSNTLFETLENRQMFAVAIGFVAPDTLTLTGNAANDTIILNDNGASPGVIMGQATNGGGVLAPFAVAGVRRILINTNGGNDVVAYNLNNDLFGVRQVICRLGTGNDTFRMNALNDVDIWAGSYLQVQAFGEAGDDTMSMYHRGEVDGQEYLINDGGDGQDVLVQDVRLDAGSTGGFFARSLGQMGDDKQWLLVRKQLAADPISINAVASGGAGFDSITRTPWAANDATCEVVAVVP
jgi:hypothetical protein